MTTNQTHSIPLLSKELLTNLYNFNSLIKWTSQPMLSVHRGGSSMINKVGRSPYCTSQQIRVRRGNGDLLAEMTSFMV